MKRSVFFLSLGMILSSQVYSGVDLKKFCKDSDAKLKLAKEASENNGWISKEKPRRKGGPKKYMKYYFDGCHYQTTWIRETHEALCKGDEVKSSLNQDQINRINYPKNILFFFDGAGDFNAEIAEDYIDPINLTGDEGRDLLGSRNGLKALFGMLNIRTLGSFRGYSTSYNHPLQEVKKDLEIHYHPGSGLKGREDYASAKSCALQTKQNLDVLAEFRDIDTKWLVMGFSNGGKLALDFQEDASDNDISIDLAFVMDPIAQAITYHLDKLNDTIGEKAPQTKRLINIYQSTDYGSLKGFELRGKPVVGADENYELGDLGYDGKYNHILLPQARFIQKTSACEFGKAIFNTESYCR